MRFCVARNPGLHKCSRPASESTDLKAIDPSFAVAALSVALMALAPCAFAAPPTNAAELYRQGGRGLYDEALVMARDWGFRFSSVRVPVRIWHGELDQAVPVAMGRHLAAALPAAEGTFLPGEAHHIFLDRWEEILGEVAERSRAHLPRGAA